MHVRPCVPVRRRSWLGGGYADTGWLRYVRRLHKLDCRHAPAERMSAECRRLSEAPKGGHDNLRERALLELAAGFAKWPNNSRAAGAPPLSSGAARNNPRRRPRRAQLAACGPPSAVQPKG